MDAIVSHGGLPLRLDGDSINDGPDGVLDSGSTKILTDYPNYKASLATLGVAKGEKFSDFFDLWVCDFRIGRICGDSAEVELNCCGLLPGAGDKRIRKMFIGGNVVSVGPIEEIIIVEDSEGVDPSNGQTVTAKRRVPKVDDLGEVEYRDIVTPSGKTQRWNVLDPIVTLVDEYYTETRPSTHEPNAVFAPVSPPTVPGWLWSNWSHPLRRNNPKGWVLSSRSADQIFGEVGGDGLWKVTDTINFVYPGAPD